MDYIIYKTFIFYVVTIGIVPDRKGIACGANLLDKCCILYDHILKILDLVRPHQSHDNKLGKKEIQSTVVPVLAF